MGKLVAVLFLGFSVVLVAVLIFLHNASINDRPTSEDGSIIFARWCSRCHGAHGQGRPGLAPELRGRGLTVEYIKETVHGGRNRMPAHPFIRGEALEHLARYVSNLK